MKIDRHNYETFFLLYVDNELTPDQRMDVEQFVQANSDLEAEFLLWQQSRLTTDPSISFGPKDSLLRNTATPEHGSSGYEETLLSYIDNELTTAEEQSFTDLAASNPTIKKELALYLQAKLSPEASIVFPDRASLYRKEETARIIAFSWRRIAVAAVFILALSTTGILLFTGNIRQGDPAGATANILPPENKPVNNNSAALPSQKQPDAIVEQPAQNRGSLVAKTDLPQSGSEQQVTKKNRPEERDLPKQDENKVEPPLYAVLETNSVVPEQKNRTVTSATPIENKNMNPDLSASSLSINKAPVTIPTYATYNITDEGNNKTRGLFRKVTRLFERNTNIDAATDDNKLLIGSFAVSLK
ncbi:MAG: hypothetical protein GC171_13230 [Terrimonas sp.]|nr:hypothetical protein [Terrimonas sp.]